MTKRTKLPPEKSLAFQIRRTHLSFERLLAARLSRHGVKSGYWNYLRALWIRDNVTQRELSDTTSVTETTTVAQLKGMAKAQLVERCPDGQDKRKSIIHLTDKGRALEHVLMPYAFELNELALNGISKKEIDLCMSVMNRMAANLEEAIALPEGRQPRKRSTGNRSVSPKEAA